MAPKRGDGGGNSGSGSSGISPSCPHAFQDFSYNTDPTLVVDFVRYYVVFALTLVVLISLCCIMRRHGGVKRLAGPIYLLALLCTLTDYALLIISTMLKECETTDSLSYFD
ncbi:uncharacterized protein ALTATR162_LOCUS10946 [Alternaria atra]|uniref:Uncharacterized protein n=1 Tax=Alternaria atra TaxID=119953 RepID=A0A8J2N6T3_9PLEO|nr:uncharacterized protein ALTATR162_LOCUS10946 [Alternaria atra]CAG5184512.1 unnamed protein product [Alternaria atra]